MKVRHGFVSNSSSSSFVVHTKNLTHRQIEYLKNFAVNAFPLVENFSNRELYLDLWSVREDDSDLIFSTYMDNFDLYEWARNYLIGDIDSIIERRE